MSIKHHSTHPQGFISVVALGITMMMMIVGISLAEANINNINEIKMWNNYYHAKDLARSGMEFLKYNISTRESGFNQIITCGYGKYSDINENYDVCEDFAPMTFNERDEQQDAKITFEIQGRAKESDKFIKGCIGTEKSGCYTVPLPGKGSAGDRCDLHTPDKTNFALMVDNNARVGGTEGFIPQHDYSCNWNKLQFGSSMLDRVAIPLYYDNTQDGDPERVIVNPYNGGFPLATDLVVRLRTPCLPCAKTKADVKPGLTRDCSKYNYPDETMCTDTERFVLDDKTLNEVVVQWQITGTCVKNEKEDECGLIPYESKLEEEKEVNSRVTEKRINDGLNWKNITLKKISQGLDTSTFPPKATPILNKNNLKKDLTPLLPIMKKPILSLMLSGKLLTDGDGFVPYLEYQVLTDHPIGQPEIKLQARSTYNTNGGIQTYYKKVKKEVVDFAVQN